MEVHGGMRVWRAFDVGPGKFYSAAQLARLGTPQGPTELVTVEPFSKPTVEMGTYQQRAESTRAISEPGPSQELPSPSQIDEDSEMFSCHMEGCIKMFQSFSALQEHLDVGKHMVKLARVRLRRDKEKMDGDVPFRRWRLHLWSDRF